MLKLYDVVITDRELKHTRKAKTRGLTDHLVAYLQFPMRVCFSTDKTELRFPISTEMEHFHPMTLNFDL